jgi:hypothetical protein
MALVGLELSRVFLVVAKRLSFTVRSPAILQKYGQRSHPQSLLALLEPSVPPKRLILFLIAAFCRLAKLLSYSEHMRWLVGAVGIEPTTFGLKGRCSTTELRP